MPFDQQQQTQRQKQIFASIFLIKDELLQKCQTASENKIKHQKRAKMHRNNELFSEKTRHKHTHINRTIQLMAPSAQTQPKNTENSEFCSVLFRFHLCCVHHKTAKKRLAEKRAKPKIVVGCTRRQLTCFQRISRLLSLSLSLSRWDWIMGLLTCWLTLPLFISHLL